MLEAVRRVRRYTSGTTFDSFCADDRTVDAVIRNLALIGEAARHVGEETTARCPAVPWIDIRDMRNVLVHEYFGVDLQTVWRTVVDDLPALEKSLAELLDALGPPA
jgi:uncharacterized protein with HEPN domain